MSLMKVKNVFSCRSEACGKSGYETNNRKFPQVCPGVLLWAVFGMIVVIEKIF